MRSFRFIRSRRFWGHALGFALAGAGFVLTDAILKQNSLKITGEGAHQEGEFGALVNWLPEEAKLAIEYRARSLYLQNRMRRTRDPDERVKAIHAFGDYIRTRDPAGSDSVFVGIVERPEFNRSRFAYLGYGELLLNGGSRHPVSVEELHGYLRTMRWPEDRYHAWEHIQRNMNSRRLPPETRCRILAPLLEDVPRYRHFERFLADLEKSAERCGDEGLRRRAAALREESRKWPWIPAELLKTPVSFRNRYALLEKDLEEAGNDSQRFEALLALSRLFRNVDEKQSQEYTERILGSPACLALPEAFRVHASLLLYSRSRRRCTIPQYHRILAGIRDDALLYQAWEAGFAQLAENKNSDRVQLEYLRPLTGLRKEYVEYADLFRRLEQLTLGEGHEDLFAKASAFLQRVQETDMPSLFNQAPPGRPGGRRSP